MRLNCIGLKIAPLPHQLDGAAGKFYDRVLPDLFELISDHPDAKLCVTISGFLLERLEARDRKTTLERLAKLSSSQFSLLRYPFFDLSGALVSVEKFNEQLDYQTSFWKKHNGTVSNSYGPFTGLDFLNYLPDKAHALINVGGLPIAKALVEIPSGIMLSPTSVINLSDRNFEQPAWGIEYLLTERARLRLLTINFDRHTEEDMGEQLLHALKVLFKSNDDGFLLPEDFAFPGSATLENRSFDLPKQQEVGLVKRVKFFWEQLDAVPGILEARNEQNGQENQRGERHGPEHKVEEARKFAHQASSIEVDDFQNPKAERSVVEHVLRGVVELESFLHPDIDPGTGWVKFYRRKIEEQPEAPSESLVNTQLADYSLSATGELTGLEFKPHKCSLFSPFLEPSFGIKASILPRSAIGTAAKITRKTLDLLAIRFESILDFSGAKCTLFREFTFRAGVGAHLPNATTGFSMEYWAEGTFPPELMVTLNFTFILPTPGVESGFCKPLLCVGGVSEKRTYLERPAVIDPAETPGGLFGLRIIDSVEDLIIDVRSSKQLEGVSLTPVFFDEVYRGTTCSYMASAKRIIGDERSNTIFLSIM